eukprot:scaffold289148_cov26-Tisochrysis_lutea.AAC.5
MAARCKPCILGEHECGERGANIVGEGAEREGALLGRPLLELRLLTREAQQLGMPLVARPVQDGPPRNEVVDQAREQVADQPEDRLEPEHRVVEAAEHRLQVRDRKGDERTHVRSGANVMRAQISYEVRSEWSTVEQSSGGVPRTAAAVESTHTARISEPGQAESASAQKTARSPSAAGRHSTPPLLGFPSPRSCACQASQLRTQNAKERPAFSRARSPEWAPWTYCPHEPEAEDRTSMK